jgi:hypothetical protein
MGVSMNNGTDKRLAASKGRPTRWNFWTWFWTE